MEKNPGMNTPYNFSESLETVLGQKILNFFDADPDPGSGNSLSLDPGGKIRIRDPG
jgi:hypothetical protein